MAKKEKEPTCKVICRELGPEGWIAYVLKGEFGAKDINALHLRSLFNIDLEYFAVKKESLTKEQTPIILDLIAKCGETSVTLKI